MDAKEIRSAVLAYQGAMHTASLAIQALQDECPHENVHRNPEAIEGYSEPTVYVYHCHCRICDKFWTEPQ